MSYYLGDYYQGDYYEGDFFGAIGKQLKRSFRDVSRVARAAAPLVAFAVPGLGALGAVAKVGGIVSKVNRAKGLINSVRGVVSTAVAPDPMQTPAAQMTELTGRTVGMPVLMSAPTEPATAKPKPRRRPRSQGSRIAARSKRTAYRRRKATTRRTRSAARRRTRTRR